MKTALVAFFSLCIGLACGWYCGYTRPLAHYEREFRSLTGWDDAQMKQAMTDSAAAMKTMEADDTSAVLYCGSALVQLEAGNIEKTKEALAMPLSSFYTIYGPPNAANKKMSEQRLKTLLFIERIAAKSPIVQNKIAPKQNP